MEKSKVKLKLKYKLNSLAEIERHTKKEKARMNNKRSKAEDIRDAGSVPGSGRSPGGGSGYPLQYSGLGNPTDREAWWAIAHSVAESDMTEAI